MSLILTIVFRHYFSQGFARCSSASPKALPAPAVPSATPSFKLRKHTVFWSDWPREKLHKLGPSSPFTSQPSYSRDAFVTPPYNPDKGHGDENDLVLFNHLHSPIFSDINIIKY